MNSAGLLTVQGRWANGAVRELVADLQRPSVTRLFIGQLPEAVVKTVPYLFTLCGHAQRAAAQAALAVAQGKAPRPANGAELWIEVLHENLWRLLLDWPPALGLPPQKDAFIAWRNGRHGEDCLAITQCLLENTLRPLAEKCLEKLVDCSTRHEFSAGQPVDAAPPPSLAPEDWLVYWQGGASAMPAMAQPVSIGALYRARLAEVEAATRALADDRPFTIAVAGGDGWGVAQTLTARGVLTHAAHVVDGKVANYRVQAPTDAYFADARPLSSLLENCSFSSLDQARKVLNQAILALDPCLPYEVELQDA